MPRVVDPDIDPPEASYRSRSQAFYLFVCSIPFEFSDRDARDFPIEIPTAMGVLFLATTILQPRTSFGRPSRPARWYLVYLYMFVVAAAMAHVALQRFEAGQTT